MITDCSDVDVDKLSYFEFVDIVKEIGYNCAASVVYIKPPKSRHVEVKSDRDIMGIAPKLTNEDIVELYVTHLVEEDVVAPPAIEYLNDVGGVDDVGGKSNATFNKESSQTFQDNEGLGFEEPAQPIVGEELSEVFGRNSTCAGEELCRASASAGEELGRTSTSAGEELGRVSVSGGEDLGGVLLLLLLYRYFRS